MNVIFDISPVGNRPETRTGLARVAWSTALRLHQELGSQVSFSAAGSLWASLQAEALLNELSDWQSAIHPLSPLGRQVHSWQETIAKTSHNTQGLMARSRQFFRNCLLNLSRLLNLTRTPIDPRCLHLADIFHSSYARIPAQVREALPNRHVLTVNDLIPLIFDPSYFGPGQRGITQRIIDSVQPNDWVITISQSTRNDLCNSRPVNPERVVPIHLAAAPEIFYPVISADTIDRMRQKYAIPPGKYLLTLHSLAPHKNLRFLLRCFNQVIRHRGFEDLSLVVCGGQGQSVHNARQSLLEEGLNLDQVHLAGFIEDSDLAALYSGAHAFVFPSLYEGFGLPVLEAMQCGCPVITSDVASLPEIIGQSGLLIDPTDENSLCDAIIKVSDDAELCNRLSMLGRKRAELFTWEKTIQQTFAVYNRMLAEG